MLRGRNQGEFYPSSAPSWRASTRDDGGVTGRPGDRGFVIEACYSAMGLLSAGGRLPQAEKSRDPGARLPLPQVYDSAERDRNNDLASKLLLKIRPRINELTKAL